MPEKQNSTDWPSPASRFVAAAVLGVLALTGLAMSMGRQATSTQSEQPDAPLAGERGVDGLVGAGSGAPIPRAEGGAIGKLDLNTAGRAELEMLPGVGPALAGRIIADRASAGAFKSVDDLTRVKGIGPRMIERLRGLVKVD